VSKQVILARKSYAKELSIRYNSNEVKTLVVFIVNCETTHTCEGSGAQVVVLNPAESSEQGVIQQTGRRLALVVGTNGPTIPSLALAVLHYAVDDGRDMANTLYTDACGFELFRPALLGTQATSDAIQDAVLDLAEELVQTPERCSGTWYTHQHETTHFCASFDGRRTKTPRSRAPFL
jgi:hypothetical protein